ncbi:MAG: hypothetical protein ACR2ID_11050 [Chthoniobacterales bacterium]
MISPLLRLSHLLCVTALLGVMVCAPGCQRPISREEKAARAVLRQALRDHAYARAVELAAPIVGAHPQEDGAWARLVRARLGAGDVAAAKQSLQDWRSVLHNASPKREELAGDIAVQQQDPALAIESWSKTLAAQPQNRRVLHKLARLQHAQGAWAEEDAAHSALLALEDNGADRMSRALGRRRAHRWTEAMEDDRRAQELAPDDPDVRRGAKLFARIEKLLPEIRALDARLAISPGDDQLLTDRALVSLRAEDPEAALADCQAATAISREAARPRLLAALALMDLNRSAEIRALEVDAGLRLDQLTPQVLETISRLDAEIAVEPENHELRVARAWELNDIGQPQLALADAEAALQGDPPSAAAAAECAYALAKLDRGDDATEQIRRATELDANSATAWQYRGELDLRRGDPDAAITSLTRALALSQTVAALEKREECYRQIGMTKKAEEDRHTLEKLTGRAPN